MMKADVHYAAHTPAVRLISQLNCTECDACLAGPSSIPVTWGDQAYAKTTMQALLSDNLPRVEFPALQKIRGVGVRDPSGVVIAGPLSPRPAAAAENKHVRSSAHCVNWHVHDLEPF